MLFTVQVVNRFLLLTCLLLSVRNIQAQDSVVFYNEKAVTLKEVVVDQNINVHAFIRRIQDDTSFYKAFRNLRVLGYSALNDVRMINKAGVVQASMQSRSTQHVLNGCRWTEMKEAKHTGDMYTISGGYNYYTAQMYAGLFFTSDTVCGETNKVSGNQFSMKGKAGLSKHKEQLKMLFFNPGKRIPGIPFIGNKIALFDEDVSALYDFVIDMEEFRGQLCYVFRQLPRSNLSAAEKSKVVINEMMTWFDPKSWEIVARRYDLSYNAGVYDFDVHVEVEMEKFEDLLVPRLLKYNGNWDVAFKKRERGVFTATLFGFSR